MAGTFASGLKTVQRGTLTMDTDPDTVTILAVVVAKSFLVMSTSSSSTSAGTLPRGTITNTTTLTFNSAAGGATSQIGWEVVEYY